MECVDVSLHSVWIYLLSLNGCAFWLWNALYGQHSSICVHNWMNNSHQGEEKEKTRNNRQTHTCFKYKMFKNESNALMFVLCKVLSSNQTKVNRIKDWLIETASKKRSKSVHLRALRTVTSKMKWQGNSNYMQIILSPLRRVPFAWITRV